MVTRIKVEEIMSKGAGWLAKVEVGVELILFPQCENGGGCIGG